MNILIVYGGNSCEHDISVITGCLARGYFDANIFCGYFSQENVCYWVPNNVTPHGHTAASFKDQIVFLPGKKSVGILRRGKIRRVLKVDVVVNCCHGRCGEDGMIAALCEMCNLPLVGSGIVPSAVAMDKILTKQVLSSMGFPTLPGFALFKGEDAAKKAVELGFPLVVKPATLGSSIGISRCNNDDELQKALDLAFSYDERVLCEKALTNFFELNCAVMKGKEIAASRVERPYTSNDILTFWDKYQRGEKLTHGEAVPKNLEEKVQALSVEIYKQLCFGGVVRIDYLVDEHNNIFVNEINSVPGSLAYGLWQHLYTPSEYGTALVLGAVDDFNHEQMLNRRYESSVLDGSTISKK